jgi:hypothetical protein
VLIGSRAPRVKSVPLHAEGATSGPEAVEYAASVGLHLDPWQSDFLDDALAEIGAVWAAFEVAGIVGRQSGKGAILEARELSGVEIFGERLIMHTAHELKTAEEAFLRMVQLIEESADLDRKVMRVSRSNGKEAVYFRGAGRGTFGARIKYIARSGKSGRGFAGADLVVFDEAMFLAAATMGAIVPTLTTSPNPQIWYMASGLLAESTHLAELRARALAGGDRYLMLAEWSAKEGADLDDRQQWAAANPGLGFRTTERFLERERQALPEDEWAREVMCLHGDGGSTTVIDPDRWAALEDRGSRPADPVAFGLEVPPDRSTVWISVSGTRLDKRKHTELVACCVFHAEQGGRCAGTAWCYARLAELDKRWKPNGIFLDPSGPAGALIVGLTKADVELELVGAREMAQASGEFYDLVLANGLRHLGQPELNTAVGGARKRPLAGAWTWQPADASVNIAPLRASTLAVHGVDRPTKRKRRTGRAMAV